MKLALGPLLRRLHVKQNALAAKVGVDKSYISEIVAGKKQPSLSVLQDIATALGVPPGDLWDDERAVTGEDQFSESEASPYVPRQVNDVDNLIHRLAPDGKHLTSYRIHQTMPSFGMLSGDLVVLDLNRSPSTGEIVIANIPDDYGGANTVVRRLVGDFLVADAADIAPVSIDDAPAAVLGVVVAVLRSRIVA